MSNEERVKEIHPDARPFQFALGGWIIIYDTEDDPKEEPCKTIEAAWANAASMIDKKEGV